MAMFIYSPDTKEVRKSVRKLYLFLCELLQKVSVWQGIAIELKKEKEERKSKQSN